MSEAGYTLVETLVAVAILALAVGGLSAGIEVLGRQHAAAARVVADTQAARAAQAALDRLFEHRGSYRSHEAARFSGGDRRLTFDCGRAEPCAAELVEGAAGPSLHVEDGPLSQTLRLRVAGHARFLYQGDLGPSPVWPPQRPERQALRAVSLVREPSVGLDALVTTRLWGEEPLRCEFDPVMQDCR